MSDSFVNVYDDSTRSAAYASLEFPGTYYLAYRDLPAVIRRHVKGTRALDFGCGAGRSTRFLRGCGFDVLGVDISAAMLAHARARDPAGDYRLVSGDGLGELEDGGFDLAFAAFTFDNVPTLERKVALFTALRESLREDGRIITVVSSPEIYLNEWASFSTRDFPENRGARCGDLVHITMLDVPDRRPVEDILWTDEGYAEVYRQAGLVPLEMLRPLGHSNEPYPWVSETTRAPWVVYVLSRDPDAIR